MCSTLLRQFIIDFGINRPFSPHKGFINQLIDDDLQGKKEVTGLPIQSLDVDALAPSWSDTGPGYFLRPQAMLHAVLCNEDIKPFWKRLEGANLLIAMVLILFCWASPPACAQQKYLENGFRPITPSAYAFFKYTDNPVNQYNGIPNISVPIHTFNLDGKAFPLAFSYHAGGIRVDEEASWVGLGWDLSMPAVVQTINDEDDFRVNTLVASPTQSITQTRPDYPVYSAEYPLNPNVFPSVYGWSNPYPSTGVPAVQASIAYTIATDYYFPLNGTLTQRREMFGAPYPYTYNDSEPDIVKVSLFDETLTLIQYFGSTGFEVLDHKGYRVDKTNAGYLTTDGDGWTITDPEGYRYVFAKKQVGYTKANENSIFGQGGNNIATPSTVTWYLTGIISPRGHNLDIVYNTMNADHVCNRHSEKYQTFNPIQNNSYMFSDRKANSPITVIYSSSGSVPGIFATDVEVRERRVYPSYISAPDASLTFEVSTARQDADNSPRLDGILITGRPDGGQKHFVLQHSYFQGTGPGTTYQPLLANGDNAQSRLQLTGIAEENVGQYSFSYDAEPLPSRYSYAQDYWGYYNGCTTNTTLVPNSTGLPNASVLLQPNSIATNHHGAQLRYARAGTLTGITYPTGGSTRYEYELNTFSNYAYWVPDYDGTVNTYSTGNGLRIKAIRSYAGNGQLALSETYEYSGGKALLPLDFIRASTYTTFRPATNNTGPCGGEETDDVIGGISCSGQYSPSPTSAGTGVGYSVVTHRRTGAQNGATVTYYTNNPDIFRWSNHGTNVIEHALNISVPAYSDPDLRKTGAVDSVVQLGSNGRRVQKSAYTYVNLNSVIYYGARTLGSGLYYQLQTLGSCQWETFSRDWIGFYPIFGKRLLKATETVTSYSQNGEAPFSTTTTFAYDNLDRVTSVAKRGKLLAEYSTYTYPVRVYYGATNPQEQELCNQNRIQEVMAYSYWRGPSTGTASPPPNPLYRYTKQYASHATGPVVNQVVIEESADGTTSSGYTYNYANFDSWGRAQRVFRSAGPVTTYFWHDERPEILAEVKNNASGIAAYTSFEGNTSGNWSYFTTGYWAGGVTGGAHHNLQDQQVLSLSLTPDTYTVSYWAKNGTPTCQIANGTANDQLTVRTLATRADGWTQYQATVRIATSGAQVLFPAGQTGVWLDELRLYPATAQMTSFVGQPLRGVTSTADLNGRLSSYEYDAGNRLQRVRDEQQRILLQYQYQFARP